MRRWRSTKKFSDTKLWAEYLIQLQFRNTDERSLGIYGRALVRSVILDASTLSLSILKHYYHYNYTMKDTAAHNKCSKYHVQKTINYWRERVIQTLINGERQILLDFGGTNNDDDGGNQK